MNRDIIEHVPDFKEAQQLFGQKEYKKSAQLCRQLIKNLGKEGHKSLACSAFLNLLALNAHHLGKFASALRLFRVANSISPSDPRLLSNQALIFKAQGDIKSAIASYDAAIMAAPDNMELYDALARLYVDIGQHQKAIECLETALRINNNHIPTLLAVGSMSLKMGQEKTAIKVFKKILVIFPNNIQALMSMGLCLQRMDLHCESIGYYRKILSLEPANVQAYTNLGVAYKRIEEYEPALECYKKAIELAPNIDYLHFNLGGTYAMLNQYDAAISSYKRALELNPRSANILNGLGFTLQNMGKLEEAVGYYGQAIELDPNHVDAHLNNALANLIMGNLVVGWQEYEWRWKKAELAPLLDKITQPWWMGSSLAGKTLLVMGEQGFGDSILFSRFLELIQKEGGRVLFICRHELLRLFKQLPSIDRLIRRGEVPEQYDYFIPLLSLPRVFGSRLETLPANIPYLKANVEDINRFKPFFQGKEDKLKIGICWSGSPTNVSARYRSCQFADFASLFDVPNTQFYSLQKSIGVGDAPAHTAVIDVGNHLMDFADSAAVVEQLDLIITIDTAIGHLAGAMGKPVWMVLSSVNNWPWIWHRDDSPWYPTVKLFRQEILNDWTTVFAQVKQALLTKNV
jgi:tetratricopeptide (TPR) repeat protein